MSACCNNFELQGGLIDVEEWKEVNKHGNSIRHAVDGKRTCELHSGTLTTFRYWYILFTTQHITLARQEWTASCNSSHTVYI
eukprot:scaffold15981_cov18-Prasinocladus_malaysianus.AAC.2